MRVLYENRNVPMKNISNTYDNCETDGEVPLTITVSQRLNIILTNKQYGVRRYIVISDNKISVSVSVNTFDSSG